MCKSTADLAIAANCWKKNYHAGLSSTDGRPVSGLKLSTYTDSSDGFLEQMSLSAHCWGAAERRTMPQTEPEIPFLLRVPGTEGSTRPLLSVEGAIQSRKPRQAHLTSRCVDCRRVSREGLGCHDDVRVGRKPPSPHGVGRR